MCEFCEELKKLKEISDYYSTNNNRKNQYGTIYKVAIVSHTTCNGQETYGTCTYNSKPLKFCPTCGKDLSDILNRNLAE